MHMQDFFYFFHLLKVHRKTRLLEPLRRFGLQYCIVKKDVCLRIALCDSHSRHAGLRIALCDSHSSHAGLRITLSDSY